MGKTLRSLIVMEYIYNPSGFDWMNIKLTKHNKYTYHHIAERKNGGDDSVENGAILTAIAHNFLNVLEQYCPEAYNDLQNVFIRINASHVPPSYEIMSEVDQILHDVFYTDKYRLNTKDLPSKSLHKYIMARGAYITSRKKLEKCLK